MRLFRYGAPILALAIALSANLAEAQSPSREQIFDRFDLNGDGQVTQGELAELRSLRFAELDTDGDGVVSGNEITRDDGKRVLSRMDRNGDGALSLAEFTAPQKGFSRIDRNGDGAWSRDEFSKIPNRMARRIE